MKCTIIISAAPLANFKLIFSHEDNFILTFWNLGAIALLPRKILPRKLDLKIVFEMLNDGISIIRACSVLIGQGEIVKISDFGTSRQWNEISTKMTFVGTVAWMAPEVIRNEPCSEKVDIWSYGVVLWELLSGEIPYKDVDSSAVMWGVGSNSLRLPIPANCPEGYGLLIKQCWAAKPRNRPSFKLIEMHLAIAAVDVLSTDLDNYFKAQVRPQANVILDLLSSIYIYTIVF